MGPYCFQFVHMSVSLRRNSSEAFSFFPIAHLDLLSTRLILIAHLHLVSTILKILLLFNHSLMTLIISSFLL